MNFLSKFHESSGVLYEHHIDPEEESQGPPHAAKEDPYIKETPTYTIITK